MSISVTAGASLYRDVFAVETLTQSTSTSAQTIALTTPLTTLSGGTASGFEIDNYLLSTASAVEGQEKTLIILATGEAKIQMTGTATGRLVLGTTADGMVKLQFLRGKWRIMNSTATIADAT